MITAGQCRAARAFLDWSQADLAKATAVSLTTIRNFEAGRTTPIALTLKAICEALEAEGVEFTNGDVPGVKHHQRPQ